MALQFAPAHRGELVQVAGRHESRIPRRHEEVVDIWSGRSGRMLLCGGLVSCRARRHRTRLWQQAPSIQLDLYMKEQELQRAVQEIQPDLAMKKQELQQLRSPHQLKPEGKPLHPEQARAVQEIVDLFQEQQQVLLHGVTGSGKTFVSEHVFSRLPVKAVLVVEPVKELATQLQKVFSNDFVDAKSFRFVSRLSRFSPSRIVVDDEGKLKVWRQKSIFDEAAGSSRMEAFTAVNNGDSCIVTCTTSALFSCGSLLNQVEGEMTQEEVDEMVNKLKEEVEEYERKGPKKYGALVSKMKEDIGSFEKWDDRDSLKNMHEWYADLLPRRLTKTLFHKMNDSYGDQWLLVLDESHNTVPMMKKPQKAHQTRVAKEAEQGRMRHNMSNSGPMSWKDLQDNLPRYVLSMSATPCEEDLGAKVALQIRPTHICDPEIEKVSVKRNPQAPKCRSQHDLWNLILKIAQLLSRRQPEDQTIVSTIECNQADVLHAFLSADPNHKSAVIHGKRSLEQKMEVMQQFRRGELDVLFGSQMLNEGLDLPGVSTVIVADANSPGFLRTAAALTQLVGRAARHKSGQTYFLITEDEQTVGGMFSMKIVNKTIEQHKTRRKFQEAYNQQHHHTPESIPWEFRSTRKAKKAAEKEENTKPCATNAEKDGEEVGPEYTPEQIVKIFAALAQTCWGEEDDAGYTSPEWSAQWDSRFFKQEDGKEKILEQLLLIVTVPAIGPDRSHNLLEKFGDIESILEQPEAELRKVGQIREVISERLKTTEILSRLQNNRMKLDVVLSLEKFTSQVSKHFKETEKRDLSRKVTAALKDLKDLKDEYARRLMRLVVERLIFLCCNKDMN